MSKPKVFIVEDDKMLAFWLENKLKSMRYDVAGIAANGKKAINQVGETNPDVVLMDIFINGPMDGIDAAKAIKEQYKLPIIFITAYSDESTIERAKVVEPEAYLLKPIKERDLIVTLEIALYKNQYEKRLSAIYDSIEDGIITTDNQGNITSINTAAQQLTGISREAALGQKCLKIFNNHMCKNIDIDSTDKPDVHENPFYQNRKLQRTYIEREKGKLIPVNINSTTLIEGNDRVVGKVCVLRDLSPFEELNKKLLNQYTFEDIISKNEKITEIFRILPEIANSSSSTLIEGETGVGKELFARAIHNISHRKNKPFVSINCGALPETLLESELFGYEAGAFTDAKKSKPGRLTVANGGTIFLDEIGEMSEAMQVKLLRVIEEREFHPLGSNKSIALDIHLISATNKDLMQQIKQKKFREDLYYRINIFKLYIPPLKERKEDVPLLIEHFIRRFNLLKQKNVQMVSDEVFQLLMNYDYPGNIRELENILEHAVVLCKGEVIEKRDLPLKLQEQERKEPVYAGSLAQATMEFEKNFIKEVLKRKHGVHSDTAKELGISLTTLWRKLNK